MHARVTVGVMFITVLVRRLYSNRWSGDNSRTRPEMVDNAFSHAWQEAQLCRHFSVSSLHLSIYRPR